MQFKTLLVALSFGMIAFAMPADQAAEDMDIITRGFITQEDLRHCGDLPRRWERRECREERDCFRDPYCRRYKA